MKIILINLLFLTVSLASDYIPGDGSEFKMTMDQGQKANLSIYITESSFARLGVEYYIASDDLLKTQVWQQFHLGITGTSLSLDDGFILTDEMKNPEIMTKDFLAKKSDGVNLENFFFKKSAELEKFRIADEKVEVPAGVINASHFRKIENGQTVDFWISDKAAPIGTVKLISKGTKSSQNYTIELSGLLKNVKPKIDPKKATPLSEKGKLFLKP